MKSTKCTSLALACLFGLAAIAIQEAQAGGGRTRRFDTNQYYKRPNSVHGKTVVLPIGTTFEGRIDSTISSQRSMAGQRFAIIMSSPLIANGTDVIVPAGSQVVGEVVEAVPASRVFRPKGVPKQLIKGKLRVQINGLLTPDGITHPLVADLAGDSEKDSHGRARRGRHGDLGTSVAYMGSTSGFEAVNTAAQSAYKQRPGSAPRIMNRSEALRHEIFGYGSGGQQQDDNTPIRSLILVKRDYWIMQGSSLSVRLSAPFKMGITPQGMGAAVTPLSDEPVMDEALPASTRNQGGFDPGNDTFNQGGPTGDPGRGDNRGDGRGDGRVGRQYQQQEQPPQGRPSQGGPPPAPQAPGAPSESSF